MFSPIEDFLPFLVSLFIAVTLIQLVYYWGIFARLAFYKKKQPLSVDMPPVSIVISARDEYYNLKENLPLILQQEYPNYEVIVVDDCSDDDTAYLLKDLKKIYDHLVIVSVCNPVNFFSGKKFPLSVGIKSAKNDILLLTDADCKPASKNWLMHMQQNYNAQTDIVLGYSPYNKNKTILSTLIQYDTINIAMQYLSYALAGHPYMGVGRNLSYRKSLFYKHNGFISHYHIRSGDDDLFINQAASKTNTRIEIHPESHTYSNPKETFREWITQKKRHLSSSKLYKFKFKFLLGFFGITQTIFYLLFAFLLFNTFSVDILLICFGLRLLTHLIIFKKVMIHLNEKKILLISPLLELFFILFNPLMMGINLLVKQKKWK